MNLGRVMHVARSGDNSLTLSSLNRKGFDSVCIPRYGTEYCVYEHSRIRVVDGHSDPRDDDPVSSHWMIPSLSGNGSTHALGSVASLHQFCPSGHCLQTVAQIPSSYSGWKCDLCQKRIPHDTSGVLHCSLCQYDVCCGCQARSAGRSCPQASLKQFCPSGHCLQTVTRIPSSYSGWKCDLCQKRIPHDTSGVLHCSLCQYDVCCGCQARSRSCPQGHELSWQNGKPSYYPGWNCDRCRKNIDHGSQGILHCNVCRYDVCHNCR